MAYEIARPSRTKAQSDDNGLYEKFQATETKIAIQKDGELTEISRRILEEVLGVELPTKVQRDRKLMAVSADERYGFVFARNKSICSLVGQKAVDLAIVGTDRIAEDMAEDDVKVIESFQDQYSWPLILASREDSDMESIDDIRRVATQYPVISGRYFEDNSRNTVDIIPTHGSTELFPYLNYGGPIDAIVDMSITGRSLEANSLVKWLPQITDIFPVLIEPKK